MKTHLFCGFVAAVVAFAAPSTRADVEFSTIANPGPNYLVGGLAILGPNALPTFPNYQSVADEFTASFTGELTSVRVSVGYSNASFEINLYSNSANALPLVSSEQTLGTVPAPATSPILQTLTITQPVLLVMGAKYWLELAPTTATMNGTWFGAGNNLAPVAISHDGSQTFASASFNSQAFEINATPLPIPEPGTRTLLGVGAFGAGWLAWRRRRAA